MIIIHKHVTQFHYFKGMAPISNIRVNFWLAARAGLPASEITFAELTKQAGYTNALIGKWHMGISRDSFGDHLHHPLNQGFDHFYGLIGTNFDDFADDGHKIVLKQTPYFNYQWLSTWMIIAMCAYCLYRTKHINGILFSIVVIMATIVCGYPCFVFNNLLLLNSMIHRNFKVVEQPIRHVGLSKRLVHEGLQFMKNATVSGKPFLLVMSFVHVHTAIKVSREFEGSSSHGVYGDAVQELDWSVGQILDQLDVTGQRNNTLVYFVSDHGGHVELGSLGGYNGVFKGGKTHGAPEGAIRVPGLFRWPGIVPAGRVLDQPVSMMDLFPTIARVAGVPLPADRLIDGVDILPLLQGHTEAAPHEFMFHYCGNKLHATRYIPNTGKHVWKWVTHLPRYKPGSHACRFGCTCGDAVELPMPHLYDVTTDPAESAPVPPDKPIYEHIRRLVSAAVNEHRDSLAPVESQFSARNVLWRYSLQDCCQGVFPFNCSCLDTVFPESFYA
ncbi:hypothetical protein DPMN_109595 [Dreissena polymorpha]|uniref:Sulfatase N-terminal domain-containing protein n=1 Tax=Dreissena polymorpha TaxID=45954 RepID=A0A9D4KAK2_DREPO|nr:hypothetical protein DPMN_109595 [Dreissena polymorpha]